MKQNPEQMNGDPGHSSTDIIKMKMSVKVTEGHIIKPSFRFYPSRTPASIDFKHILSQENLTVGLTVCPEVKNCHLLVVGTQTIN